MHLTKSDIQNAEKQYRANLINCATGSKPAMLLATKSEQGVSNLGLFSNIMHIGADPALIAVLFRPQHENLRDTYLNIQRTKVFTLNHVPRALAKNAHYTSARFDRDVSEFDTCDLTEETIEGFHAPFVKESPIKIGLECLQEIPIERNKTILLVAEIQHLMVPDEAVDPSGQIDLQGTDATAAGGLNRYYGLADMVEFPYAKPKDAPKFGA